MKLKFCLVVWEKKRTEFMQAADVFESFKVLGRIDEFNVEIKSDIDSYLNRLRSLIKEDGEFEVAALFVKGKPEFTLRETWIRVISNGKNFITLDKIEKAYL